MLSAVRERRTTRRACSVCLAGGTPGLECLAGADFRQNRFCGERQCPVTVEKRLLTSKLRDCPAELT